MSINVEQPKSKDLEIAKKQPSRPNSVSEDLKADQVKLFAEAEIFLQQKGICHAYMREFLEDKEAQKKLVRKVDLTFLPLLMGTYLLQYIVKHPLSYDAVFDLLETTNTMQSHIIYFAYLVAEWPASYLAQHFPTGTVVSVFVVSWGTILTWTAASHNFVGLVVCRFLLGAFEAVFTTCFMMVVSMWYTRKELPMRAGSFCCFKRFGSIIGSIVFYGVGQADECAVWRIILVIQSDKTSVFSRKIKPAQTKEKFKDLQIPNGGIANFGKLIVKGFTKDALLTTAYGIPYRVWVAFLIFSGPFCASKFSNFRIIVMMTWVLPTLIAGPLFLKLDRGNKNGLLMVYCTVRESVSPSFVVPLVVALQMPAANLAGYTKRVTSTAFVFLAYCVGNIIGPQAFLASKAPTYGTRCKVIMGCTAGQVVLTIVIRVILKRIITQRDGESEATSQKIMFRWA
ncbi:allantoate permease [Colletotrichum incanum]|uniref:Allantoate permease n=1 Tax=Colletotrichum incanum TaxID=1573173 RepID=A0A166RWR1_COLIC|nr:allantoate permease [Colletotrichum incanum]OHW99030.1 allantoate permease [Colletotrichum incanum]